MSVEVAGKTGTARRIVDGRYKPGSYTASFVAVVPADDPEIVIAVKLDDPEAVFSVATAVPFTRSMLEQLRAGDNSAIERSRFGAGADAPEPRPPTGTGAIPYVTDWPAFVLPRQPEPRPVPEVVGVSPREAVRRLHQLGLTVRMRGWGTIDSVVPAPGAIVSPGQTVTLFSSGRSRS